MTEEKKKGENVKELFDKQQSDAVLQSVGGGFIFLPQFTCFLMSDISVSPCVRPYLTNCPLSLSPFSSSCSENSEICPDDKQRNKAKSDEVQGTFTPYSLLHAVKLKTFFCLNSKKPPTSLPPELTGCPDYTTHL